MGRSGLAGSPRQLHAPPDVSVFASPTPGAAYWLGFLLADGCVSRRELIVVLQTGDAAHLLALAEFLRTPDRPLGIANGGAARRLAIGSARLARRLGELGVEPGRPNLTDLDRSWTSQPDFWRGNLDGDGTVLSPPSSQIPRVSLVGRPPTMDRFADYLESYFDDGFRPSVFRHKTSTVVRCISLSGWRAVKTASLLYPPECQYALERKRLHASRMQDWVSRKGWHYKWHRWSDGSLWTLRRGEDYIEWHRLWEGARREARARGRRLILRDLGDCAELQMVAR